MAIVIDIITNPLDEIRNGQIYTVLKGQTIIKGEVDIKSGGELSIVDQGSLILE